MGTAFQRTLEINEGFLKPMIDAFRDTPPAPFEHLGHLYSAAVAENVERYETIAAAMKDKSRKVALFEFGLVPQPFLAFGCAALCLETYPSFFTRTSMETVYAFIEAAESAGVSSETCSTDRFIIGAAVEGELPDNSFFVTSSAPCDGTRITYPILERMYGGPMLYLDAPFRYDLEAVRYYARQLKTELLPFLERVTGRKFDIDRLREVVEESNRAYESLVTLQDTHKVLPAPHSGFLRLVPYLIYISGAGYPGTTRTLELLCEDAVQRVREGRTQGPFEEKHRALWVHVTPTFDVELFEWMEEKFGAMVVSTSLSSSAILEPIDTTRLETMLEGIAWQGLDMTMSIMRYDTEKLIQFSLNTYEDYRCDCMIVTQHVGCNSICGAQGMIRRACREREIPVLFIEHDYNDDRILSRELLRGRIEDFFTTVMG